MKPISQDEKLVYRDEADGVSFYFRPLTGAIERQYYDIGKSGKSEMDAIDEIIDLFLIGWDGKGIPAFPADGKPSAFFSYANKTKLFDAAMRLNGVELSEAKN